MEKDATYTVNRQELIRMARESCEGNLKSSGNGRFSQGLSRKGMTSKRESVVKTPKAAKVKTKSVNTTAITEQEKKQKAIKFMLIRTICASAIFLGIVVVDKMDLTYKTFGSDKIIESVQSNHVYEKAEKFFATLQDEKIINVFNGLD
ncbi:hypothetical protein [Anaerosporobacter sp.]|uniref:hypothetical protein n=1 Tax=Anaerosporobacter sp. TaxID=1872529 RepID=UPI00286F385A|nr:hypothetical protein [Anaerosporobacter sp.]